MLACCGTLPDPLEQAACTDDCIEVHAVQGRETESPLSGQRVKVCGVVTLELGAAGFYVQSAQPDLDASTSEGLFIATEGASVERGQRIRLEGRVREHEGVTQIHAVERLQTCGALELSPAPAPPSGALELEPWESMWVTSADDWFITDVSQLASDGLIEAAPGARPYAPGHELGGATPEQRWKIRAAEDSDTLMTILPRVRLGARSRRLTGVVRLSPGGPELLATAPSTWSAEDVARPPAPGAGSLRVVSLNLNNYFAEYGRGGAGSEAELTRQRAKLVAALRELNGDVLALTELGNAMSSLEHLAAGLNAELGENAYVHSAVAPPAGPRIRAGLLYRAARIQPVGDAWFETSPVFTRPPLLQRLSSAGHHITVGVLHLKSKRCASGESSPEVGGCGAETRMREVAELTRLGARLLTLTDERLLLIGDFNADSHEEPMLELRRAGFVDLMDAVAAETRYSYVFDGRAGLLDHAFAAPALLPLLVRAEVWHINADEAASRDYRLENPGAEYRADPWRCSDHDPIWIDLRL